VILSASTAMTDASPSSVWRLSGNTWKQRGIASCGMEMVEMMKMLTLRISMITAAGFVKLSIVTEFVIFKWSMFVPVFPKHHGKVSEIK